MSSLSSSHPAAAHSGPWWRHPMMWLVVGGPAIVVLASFVTIYLAVSRPDPVYSDASRAGSSAQQSAEALGKAELVPAIQARNHAATGGLAKPAAAASAAAPAER